MKKILFILGITSITLILSTACSTSEVILSKRVSLYGSSVYTSDNQDNKNAIYVGNANSKDILKLIKIAGEKSAWRVTEFKTNAVIVEKTVGDKSMSSTIKFYNGYISGNDSDASMKELLVLREAIINELQSKAEFN
ncbi:MAG: hypothetical protein COB17_01495 [Sulfurimonas sp.]|nr:MAG: hypothetical protein COB17_01495 [Sulfurimonas sp.]